MNRTIKTIIFVWSKADFRPQKSIFWSKTRFFAFFHDFSHILCIFRPPTAVTVSRPKGRLTCLGQKSIFWVKNTIFWVKNTIFRIFSRFFAYLLDFSHILRIFRPPTALAISRPKGRLTCLGQKLHYPRLKCLKIGKIDF